MRGWSIEDQRLVTWWHEEGFEGESSWDTRHEETLTGQWGGGQRVEKEVEASWRTQVWDCKVKWDSGWWSRFIRWVAGWVRMNQRSHVDWSSKSCRCPLESP